MFISENENERLLLEKFYQWEEERLFDSIRKPLKKWEMDLLRKVGKIRRNRIKKILNKL